jgi:hypothetical protein
MHNKKGDIMSPFLSYHSLPRFFIGVFNQSLNLLLFIFTKLTTAIINIHIKLLI